MQHETMTAAAATEARAQFTIAARPLADAVKFLSGKVTERRNSIPILSTLLIEAAPCGRVTITATDLDIMATVTLAADATEEIEPGALCLDSDALSKLLAKVSKAADRVRIEAQDRGRATLKASRNEYKLPGLPRDDFPVIAAREAECSGVIARGQFLADLKALSPAVSTEETRYYLNGYAMQVRELAGAERLAMVATNGGNMAVTSRPIPAGLEGWADAIMPRKLGAVMLAADKVAGEGEGITLSRLGALFVALEFGAVRIVSKLVDGTFPDWRNAFECNAVPTDGKVDALFPDMMPGRPLAAMDALGKAAPTAIQWGETATAFLGASATDTGLAWCCMKLAKDNEPRNGYRYSDGESRDHARAYLKALADAQGLPGVDSFRAKAEAVNDRGGGTRGHYASSFCHLETSGGRVLGLTVGGKVSHYARWETVQDWEALCERQVEVPAYDEPMEGSYSILMPADGPAIEHDYSVTVEGDRTYPVAVNSGGKIHLSKEQVAALCGDDLWQVIEFAGPDGKPRYVSQWCYEQGDSRLLCVGKDGRTPKAGAVREYFTREQVAAALAGEVMAVPVIEAAAPTVEACQISDDSGNVASAPETALPCDAEPAPATHAAPMPENAPIAAPVAAEAASDAAACPIAAIRARLAEVEAMLAALPAQSARPKRTAAHERAIRRAWAERCARREAEADAVMWARVAEIRQGKRRAAVAKAMRLARDLATAKQHAIGWEIRFEREREALQAEIRAGDDRARLAEQIAEDHLQMREQMRAALCAAERRAETAEAENAELWAEIEALTAPATPVGAIRVGHGAA